MKQEDVISSVRKRYLNINSFSEILLRASTKKAYSFSGRRLSGSKRFFSYWRQGRLRYSGEITRVLSQNGCHSRSSAAQMGTDRLCETEKCRGSGVLFGIQSQLSLLTNYRDVVLRINMLQDPNFLFANGQGAKPFLQAVLQEWIREKQRLRAAINASPVSGEERPVVRRRRARPVIRSLTACDFS